MEQDRVLKAFLKKFDNIYEFKRYLGSGASSNVYVVYHKLLAQRRALKLMDIDFIFQFLKKASIKDSIEELKKRSIRFISEAKIFRDIIHPNIVTIHDVGVIIEEIENIEVPYILMDFVDGLTLSDILKEKFPMEMIKALTISKNILDALDKIHKHGIVHRDVKPSNIIIEKRTDRAILIDFGLAKDIFEDRRLTTTGVVMGTPIYMSPEQFMDSGKVGPETDIYAFGVILYQMLTGGVPFIGKNAMEIMHAHIYRDVPNIREENPELPKGIENIIFKSLAKEPKKRYGSAKDFLDDLNRFMKKAKESLKLHYSSPQLEETQEMPQFDRFIPLLKSSELPELETKQGKIIILDAKKGEILNKKPRFAIGKNVRYYWVSPYSRTKNETECQVRDFLTNQSITMNIKYEASCTPGNEEKIVLALYKGNKLEDVLNKLIKSWVQDFADKKRQDGVNPIPEYYKIQNSLKSYLCKKAIDEVGLNMKCTLSLKYENELKEYTIKSNDFPVSLKDFDEELTLKFSAGLEVIEKNKILAIINYPCLDKLEPLIREEIKEKIQSVKLNDFVSELNKSVREELIRRLNKLLEGKGRKVTWIEFYSNITSEIDRYNEEAKRLIEKEKHDEALEVIKKAEEKKLFDENTLFLKIKALEQKGEADKASQLRMELINGNTLKPTIYTDEARFLIKNERFWEAISIIEKALVRNCVNDSTHILKETAVKNLSDDEGESFKKQSNEGKSIIYPESGSIPGRDEDIGALIKILDNSPIITVYGIPGIGKSTFIHELRKSKPYNIMLYKRLIVSRDMTINDLFQELALVLGCRHVLDQPGFDLIKRTDFFFLEKEAKYRVASIIHLDEAHFLFYENRFRDPAIKEFLIAVTKFYPETKIVLESRIVPPDSILPETIHKSIRIHGIDKDSMAAYFRHPFKDNPGTGWELEIGEQEKILKNCCGIMKKGKVHPLAMALLAAMAHRLNKTPAEVLENPGTRQKLIEESGSLLLDGLNPTTLKSTGQNLSRNIWMYKEDIPVYLIDKLDKCIRELLSDSTFQDLMGADVIKKSSIDHLEGELRRAVSEKLYPEGKNYLQKIIQLAPERGDRLKKEFGYIYSFNFENPDEDENHWKQKEGQIQWRRKVWQALAVGNNFELTYFDVSEEQENKPVVKESKPDTREKEVKDAKKKTDKEKKTGEEKGKELEKAAFTLFQRFLEICEQGNAFTITNARQQAGGPQSGHDLKFVVEITGNKKSRFLIECKNYSEKITKDDIAGKLLAAEAFHRNIPIDHWILVSPNENVTNELEELIELWEETGKYPFKVQAWTPATRVKEFFGLMPGIYDEIIKEPDLKIHPKDWSEGKRQEVIEYWKQKLEPPLRLPQGWEEYLRQPDKLQLELKEMEFEKRYNNNDHVEMFCRDETGAKLSMTLEEKIYEWLEESGNATIFLLGEFGDGKTFFTYVLTRKLLEKFLKSPQDGWIPVRFALKNFESEEFRNTQEFLEHRLKNFSANIAGWHELRRRGYKILAILDGFDEISKELDPETIQKNIDILINCYESDYFNDTKILITSRKHFFENHKEKDWLIDKLDKPQLLHLAPIDRKTTEDYLRSFAVHINEEEKFNKLKACHDPIGLASKPLFLDMVQVSLKDLPEEDLNEYKLYETYILKALKRKSKYHFDKKKETPKEEIIENLLNVLELVAKRLHQSNQEFVYLSDIRGKENLKKWLWDLSDPAENTTEDETHRIAARSLLKRFEIKNQPEDKKWPVDFCHRSMREYFVGRAVGNMLKNDLEEAEKFFKSCFLSYEILFFAGEIMKHKNFDYESNLLALIDKTRGAIEKGILDLNYLGGNAVNLLYQYKGTLPGFDWRDLVLDGAILPDADLSGKDFSGTYLRYANLDNVNFSHSNFSNCNLTQVRIEETTPVQSIALSSDENILALYQDGIIREWEYQRLQRPKSTNLSGNLTGKEMKLIPHPGNDLTILQDCRLFFYDRHEKKLNLKAAIDINPNIKLIKAGQDFLLIKEDDGQHSRILLVDLNRQAIVKSFMAPSFTLCDHLGCLALVIFNENEELQVIDITPGKRNDLVIPTGDKVSCIATCQCKDIPGQYRLGLGLYNGAVQVWQIRVDQWKYGKLLEQLLHQQNQPVKDICFIDDCRIVSGGLDKTIKLFTFNQDGQTVEEPKEFKMTLQCQGMNIDGVIREKIEGKRLQEFIDKAVFA